MTIEPICDSCKRELQEFGAILFGPPIPTIKSKNSIYAEIAAAKLYLK